MSNSPIICGIIGKKLYLTLLLATTVILYKILKDQIPQGNDIEFINYLGGSALEMLSVFIPCIFKLKGKSKISTRKCTKANFKDYSILFLVLLLFFGAHMLLRLLNIYDFKIDYLWNRLCFQMIFYIILSIIILKTKYYIHNYISFILFCIFSVIIDLILGNFKIIKPISLLSLIPNIFDDLLCCYIKYLIDKKYHSYWNILFFTG